VMNHTFRVGQTYFPPKPHGAAAPAKQPSKPFQQWLSESLETAAGSDRISFSQHAIHRLKERGIQLTEPDVARLQAAVEKAADKGARESLVMMDNVAYVVSVVNRKVITAVDGACMKENVFTNIDSAVFV